MHDEPDSVPTAQEYVGVPVAEYVHVVPDSTCAPLAQVYGRGQCASDAPLDSDAVGDRILVTVDVADGLALISGVIDAARLEDRSTLADGDGVLDALMERDTTGDTDCEHR